MADKVNSVKVLEKLPSGLTRVELPKARITNPSMWTRLIQELRRTES